MLRSLKWEEREWRARARVPKLQSEAQAIFDGRIAYAWKQAEGLRSVKQSFEELWLRKEPSRGQAAGPMDVQVQAAAVAIIAGEPSSGQSAGSIDVQAQAVGVPIIAGHHDNKQAEPTAAEECRMR